MYKCKYCDKEIEPTPYQKRQVKAGKSIYCSKQCIMNDRYKDKQNITLDKINWIKNQVKNSELNLLQIQKQSGLSQSIFNEVLKNNNISRNKETINKNKIQHMNKTIKEKYNVDHIMHLDQTKNKVVNSLKDFYSSNKGKESLKQQKQTKLEKYGNENYNNRTKAKQTMINKYGVATNLERQEVQEKISQTNLQKYGVDNAFKSDTIHELAKIRMQELYNVNYGFENKEIKQKAQETLYNIYGVKNPTQNKELRQKQIQTMLERYGVEFGCETEQCRSASGITISKVNKNFAEKLKQTIPNINIEFEKKVNNYIYDLCIDNLLIDINPTISHNVTISYAYVVGLSKENNTIDKLYHYNRLQNANNNGFTLISIFDWMDTDKIIDLIKAKLHRLNNRIYGNKCKIKEITQIEANKFLNKYHLQGATYNQEVCIGLYYNNELIQVQTFGKPRFNNNVQWEAIRLATKFDTYIIGGVSKGFKYFVDKYKPESIISYNSLNISNGSTDNLQGFRIYNIQKPQCMWVNTRHNTNPFTVRAMTLRQQGIDRVLNKRKDEFPDYDGTYNTSNDSLMIQQGYVEVYDCGQITYIWNP